MNGHVNKGRTQERKKTDLQPEGTQCRGQDVIAADDEPSASNSRLSTPGPRPQPLVPQARAVAIHQSPRRPHGALCPQAVALIPRGTGRSHFLLSGLATPLRLSPTVPHAIFVPISPPLPTSCAQHPPPPAVQIEVWAQHPAWPRPATLPGHVLTGHFSTKGAVGLPTFNTDPSVLWSTQQALAIHTPHVPKEGWASFSQLLGGDLWAPEMSHR